MRNFDRLLLIGLLALAGLLLPRHAGAQERPFITKWHVDSPCSIVLPFQTGYKKELTGFYEKVGGERKIFTQRRDDDEKPYQFYFPEAGDYLIGVYAENQDFSFAIRWWYDKDLVKNCLESLIEIVQWGDLVFTSQLNIAGYKNMNIAPGAGTPKLNRVDRITFAGCESLNSPLEDWNITGVRRFSLAGCKSFNQPLEKLDVSTLTDMSDILDGCTSFDQPLGAWNVSICGHTAVFDKDKFAHIGLNNCGMSQKNYEATLAGWASRLKHEFVWVDAKGLKCECKNEAHYKLVNELHWLFVDDEECIEISGGHEIGIGGSMGLDVKFHPRVTPKERGDIYQLPSEWISSNPNVAKAGFSSVTGVQEGEATISVEYRGLGTWRASHKLRVIKVDEVDSVVIDKTKATIGTSGSVQLRATVYPESVNNKKVVWSEFGGKMFSIDTTGVVRARRTGIGRVVALSLNGKESRECEITVVQDPTEVQLSQHEMTMLVGDNPVQLTATVMPDNAVDKSITWSVEPSDVASVSAEGLVTPLKGGTAHVFATAHNGVKGECVVTVKEFVSVTEVAVAPKSMSMSLGDAPVQLTANVKPEEATIKTISWVTEPVDIVKVENGLVSPLKAGTAKVIAISHNKISGECLVTVIDPANPTPPTPNPGTNPTPNQKTAVDGGLPRVEVAPNPFSATLTVLHAEDVQRYELVDAGGAIVAKGRNQSAMLTIPTDHLVPGVYVLRLVGAEGARNIRVVKR